MADAYAQAHIRRSEKLFTDLGVWIPTWRDITELCLPRKSNITLTRSPGNPNTERMMDSEAAHSLEMLAASMQGSLTSAAITWFYFRIRGLKYGMDNEADRWLQSEAEDTHDEIAQSNFNTEAHEFYIDLASIGTAAMFMDRKEPQPGNPWSGLRYKTLAPGSFAVDENDEGRVDTLYYRYPLTARQAAQKFGHEKLPAKIKEHLTQGKDHEQPFMFLHGVSPRTDKWADRRAAALPANRPFASTHIFIEDPQVVMESGFHEFPYAVARWTKNSDEKYGRSPAFTSLANIKTLNKLIEMKLLALALKVRPPLKVRDDGVVGLVRLTPAGMTHVRDMEALDVLMTDRGGVETGMLQEEKLQGAVRRGFYADQLQLQEGPQMTAYEVQVRYELMQRILGPTLGRLTVEFLEPVVTRAYRLRERANRTSPPPASLQERFRDQGRGFDITYEGPLQRAQRLGNLVSIQRFIQLILPLVEADPEVLDDVDLSAAVREIAESTGIPPVIMRAVAAAEERRNSRRQQQQEAAKVAEQQESAKAAGAAAPALKALTEAAQSGALPRTTPAVSLPTTGGIGI